MNEDELQSLVAEYQAMCRRGQAPAPEAFAAQHPEHAAELRELLPLVAALVHAGEAEAGEETDAVGRVLGDYRLLRCLGRGGMGVVYEAEQISLQRRVAVKVPAQACLRDAAARAQFCREAQMVARLHHPHIVQVISAGEEDGVCYYAMERMSGPAGDVICRPRSAREAARCALQVARALAYAHACGVLHLDIKPGNLLTDEHGEVRVADFGLAVLRGSPGESGGTLRYMAPERAAGGPPTPACDQYALGATLYEWLLRRPFSGGKPLVLSGSQADLYAIVNRAVAPRPGDRYADMKSLAADLEYYLRGEPVSERTRPCSASRRLWLWARRKPAAAVAFCLCGLSLTLVPAVGWLRTRAALRQAQHNAEVAQDALNRIFSHVAAQSPTEEGSRLLRELLPFYRNLPGSASLPREKESALLETLGLCAGRSGDYAAAAEAYRRLAALSRRAVWLNRRAEALRLSGRAEEGRRVSERVLREFGSSAREEDRFACLQARLALGAEEKAESLHAAAREAAQLVQLRPQQPEYLLTYAGLLGRHPRELAGETLPGFPPGELLLRLAREHPESPEYGLALVEYTTKRLFRPRRFTEQDWLATEAAAGQAVQLVGRFPNTPGVVSAVVRMLRAFNRATLRTGNEVSALRRSDRMLGMLELLFHAPQTPLAVREEIIELQVQRCENARTPSAVPASLLQQVELYKGPKSQDFRRRVEALQHAAEQHRKASAQKTAPSNQPPEIGARSLPKRSAQGE